MVVPSIIGSSPEASTWSVQWHSNVGRLQLFVFACRQRTWATVPSLHYSLLARRAQLGLFASWLVPKTLVDSYLRGYEVRTLPLFEAATLVQNTTKDPKGALPSATGT